MAVVRERMEGLRASPMERRILAAAVGLFAEQGFDGTSVQQVVEAAEVTKGALYHYFASKDDLLYEIYHSLITRQLADLDRVLAARLPPGETVRAIITDLIRTTAEHIDEAKVFRREMHKLDEKRKQAVRADRRRYHTTFRRIVEDARRAGEFNDVASPETVTLVVFGLINELPLWFRKDGPTPPDRLAEEFSAFVLSALSPR